MSVGNQATLSLLTDQTLPQENMPADAKATGTRLKTLDSGVDNLNNAITRIATCEQKIKAIGGVTEVLLGTVVSPAIKGDTLQKGATHTMATFGSEVAFVKISERIKILRGSSHVEELWSIYNEGGGNYHRLYVRWDFTADGRVTATCDTEVSDTSWSWYDHTLKVNINYYSYAVAT